MKSRLISLLSVSFVFINISMGQITYVDSTEISGLTNSWGISSDGFNEFGDIDGDGDMDLVVGGLMTGYPNYTANTVMYKNDGAGKFSVADIGPIQLLDLFSGDAEFVDIDNDNDLDLFIAGLDVNGNTLSQFYLNDGTGLFVTGLAANEIYPYHSDVEFVDLDNDGDMDRVACGLDRFSSSAAYTSKTYVTINDGSGIWSSYNVTDIEWLFNPDMDFADVDADGDLDMIIVGTKGDLSSAEAFTGLYLNNGAGGFALSAINDIEDVSYGSVGFSDVDLDGDADILLSGQGTGVFELSLLYKNDGNGNFTLDNSHSIPSFWKGDLEFSDIDSDGDEDLMISGSLTFDGRSTKLFENDGMGNFAEIETPFRDLWNSGISLADIDGDLDVDFFVTGDTASINTPKVLLYENITCNSSSCSYIFDTICSGISYTFSDGAVLTVNQDTTYIEVVSNGSSLDELIITKIYVEKIKANATNQYACNETMVFATGNLASFQWQDGVQDGVSFIPASTNNKYIVDGVTINGCAVSDTIDVRYLPSDLTLLLNGNWNYLPKDLCEGATVTVSSNFNSGSWIEIGWSGGIVSNTPFTPAPNTNEYFYVEHPLGCIDSAQISLAIHPLPSLSISSSLGTNVCEQDEISLNASGASTYSWNNGVINNTPFIINNSTVYDVVGTTINGCEASEQISIHVNSKPTALLDDFTYSTICNLDNPTPLPLGSPTGGIYMSDGVDGSSFNPQLLTTMGINTLSYIYEDVNGCKDTAYSDIEVIKSPSFSYEMNGLSIILESTISCNDYFWDFGDGSSNSFTLNPAHTYSVDGAYTICLVCEDTDQCASCINLIFPGNSSGQLNLFVGLSENTEMESKVYPNPFTDVFTVENKTHGTSVSFFSLDGKKVLESELEVGVQSINVKELPEGSYVVKVASETSTQTFKVSKTK